MAFALRVFFLLCGISGLLTGAWSWSYNKKECCCPECWTLLNDNCYIYQDEARTFADAEKVCNILGGNLVSITSALENAIVDGVIQAGDGDSAWIGLSDAVEDGQYFWTDGTDFDYENWSSGEPSVQGCVGIGSGGLWSTAGCVDEIKFVCIKKSACSYH